MIGAKHPMKAPARSASCAFAPVTRAPATASSEIGGSLFPLKMLRHSKIVHGSAKSSKIIPRTEFELSIAFPFCRQDPASNNYVALESQCD